MVRSSKSIKNKKIIFFNKNWRILEKKKTKQGYIFILFNIVSTKQILIKMKERDARILSYIFNNLEGEVSEDKMVSVTRKKFHKSGKEISRLLNSLKKHKIIVNKFPIPKELSDNYLIGLDRQINFFVELDTSSNPYQIQALLKNTKVAVLGVGGIGQWIIPPLLSSGMGYFKLVDFDRVEKRNVGIQVLFRKRDIGRLKVDVVKDFINQANRNIKVKAINKKLVSEKDVEDIVRDCDIVLQCCDIPRFIIHRTITRACLKLGKPNLIAYAGRVGPFCIPYKSACYGCLENKLRKIFPFYDKLVLNVNSGDKIERFPSLYVLAALTGALAAKEIIAYILNYPLETYNGFLEINPFNLKIKRYDLPRDPNCKICGKKI